MILKIEIKEYTERYIEICTLFGSLLSLSKTLSDKMSMERIDKLEIIIKNTVSCWSNLRLSTKMSKYMI